MLDDVETVEESVLAERLAGWQEKYPDVKVIRRVYLSSPAAQLREWSEQAQLVVVGNRGRGSFLGMLLGSTAHSLVQHAYCPVMVVHPTT
ncbi:universal stress protein [Nocardia sp. CDC160]|uniref:universal stress protein n=1 Tax=Nocardia sp. CDC160 TaxID=3112166 RepID=UPI003FA3B715